MIQSTVRNMDLNKIQWALKYGNETQRKQLGELFSQINSVVDEIPNSNDNHSSRRHHDLAQLTTMSIGSAKTIEEASQLSEGIPAYDLNTCPTKLTMNLHQRLETDVGKTSRVNEMLLYDTFKQKSMAVSGGVDYPYWIEGVPDYRVNELNSTQQHGLTQLTTGSIASTKTIEETNPDNVNKDIKASELSGFYDINLCPTKLTMNQERKIETDLAVALCVNDMSWNNTYNISSNNNRNFEERMSASGGASHPYWIGGVPDNRVNELNRMKQTHQYGLATLNTVSNESSNTTGKLDGINNYQEALGLDQLKQRKSEDCYPRTPIILQQPMDVDLPWKDLYNISGNRSNHTFVAHNDASLVNYLYYLYEQPQTPIPVFDTSSEKSARDEYQINADRPLYNATATLATVSELNSMKQITLTCPQNELQSLNDTVNESTSTTINDQKIVETASGNYNNTSNAPVSDDSDLENVQFESSINVVNEDDENEMVDDMESLKTITLTQICQSNNYHDEKNYLYTKTIPRRNVKNSYYRCKNYVRHGCPARVVENNNTSDCILRKDHNHLPEEVDKDNEKFNKTLDAIIKDNDYEKPLKLYLKAKKKLCNEMDTANIGTPKSKESFIRRRKINKVPKLPKTIAEFINIMSDDKYKQYSKTERNATFYRGVWEVNGNSNIVFISQETLDLLVTMDNVILLMDGTFKVLPQHFRRRFRQLYVINFIYKGRCYPLAYILMQTKNFEAYDLIFNRLKLMIPSVRISGCMTDYEPATRNALRKHFPDATISACFFHYVQAMHKAFKRYGMLTEDKFQNAIQEVSALALLPNDDVLQGFEIISKKMKPLASKRWKKFSSYWKTYWPKANISVYDLTDRTNNFSESLNNITNSMNGPKPDIWKLISNLKLVETHKSDELKSHVRNQMFTTKKGKTDISRLNATIKQATAIYKTNKNIEEFLAHITFGKRLESFFKERIFIFGVDKDDFDDDCDDFEDVIIPNSLNVELNFESQEKNLKRKIASDGGSNNKRQVTLVSYAF